MLDVKFTIFTPVYNGAKTIHRVFESLENQTYRNFQWIIINDGSTDDSDSEIKNFIRTVDWEIIYEKQENMGKHQAWNRAMQLANGELLVPMDCDDSFSNDILEFYREKWSELSIDQRNKLSGINVLCEDENGNVIGDKYPEDGMLSNNLTLKYKLKLKGEKAGCVRIDLLKQRLFPVLKNSHYPEDYLWLYFAKYYNVICYNKVLRTYYREDNSIMHDTKKKFSKNSLKVKVSYNSWLIRNFWKFLIFNSTKTFIYSLMIVFGCSLLLLFKK